MALFDGDRKHLTVREQGESGHVQFEGKLVGIHSIDPTSVDISSMDNSKDSPGFSYFLDNNSGRLSN